MNHNVNVQKNKFYKVIVYNFLKMLQWATRMRLIFSYKLYSIVLISLKKYREYLIRTYYYVNCLLFLET